MVSNLHISHIELRTEDDPDVRCYVHERQTETVVVPLLGEIVQIKTAFLEVNASLVAIVDSESVTVCVCVCVC